MKLSGILTAIALTASMACGQSTQNASGFIPGYSDSPYLRNASEFYGQAPLDWPAAEVRELAFARARTVIARWEALYAGMRMEEQVGRLKRNFESSPEFLAAKQAEDEAWAAVQSATASVYARLMNDPQYQANMALAADLRQRIDDAAFEDPSITRTKVVQPATIDLAKARLSYAQRASAIRAEAMAADPAVAEARARHATAGGRLAQLRANFNTSIQDDPSFQSLRESHRSAKIAHLAASNYEQTVRFNRTLALRYVSYLHRNSHPNFGWPVFSSWYVRPVGFDHGVVRPGSGYGFKRRVH